MNEINRLRNYTELLDVVKINTEKMIQIAQLSQKIVGEIHDNQGAVDRIETLKQRFLKEI
jgi:hypothetical protein